MWKTIAFFMLCFFMVCNANSNNCCSQSSSITCSPQPLTNASVIEETVAWLKRVTTIVDTVARLNLAFTNSYEFCYSGLKSGRIPDSAISASSIWSNEYKPYYGRLDSYPKLWHPARNAFSGAWLQVDFGQATRVHGVVTQGRPNLDQWTTSYNIFRGTSVGNLAKINSRSNDGVFQGNRDRNSHVVNYFPSPVTARYFRLVAVTYQWIPVVRIEYLLC